VRRQDDVVEVLEGVGLNRQRLLDVDVDPGPEDPALAQRLDQRVLVDDRRAGGVEQDRGRLHHR